MKKTVFLTIFVAAAVFSFANDPTNRSIFVEGNTNRPDHLEFFFLNFRQEAIGTGYALADSRESAGFIFKFDVSNNPDAAIDGNQFVIRISLINNNNNQEILYLYFYFNRLEEMHEHTNYLFYRATSVIPPLTEAALLYAEAAWKYKWIYLRVSFDYPIGFYALKPDGLIGGAALWLPGPGGEPIELMPLDNRFNVLPGATVGIEFQFLDFMSLEVNFRVFMGDSFKNEFVNLGVGAQLKFPIKIFRLFVIQPYIAGYYPLVMSSIFKSFPPFSLGGGIQLNTRGGKNGAFFIDINYMTYLSDAVMKNLYSRLFPYPQEIHYRPISVGIGVGYKLGLFNRPRRQVEYKFVCSDTEIPYTPADGSETQTDSEQPRSRFRSSATRTFYF